ncbi:MAG: hypothetical protein ACREMY_19785, partial [bacterium]
MRIAGRLINAVDPAKSDVFEGYLVEVEYLVLDMSGGDRVFREQSQSFTLQGKDNGFHFDLPEPQSLQEREDVTFSVFSPEGSSVLEQSISLPDLLKQRDTVELKIKNIPETTVKPPLPLHGRLVVKGGGEADFSGYKVVVSYKTRQRVGSDPVVLPDSQTAVLSGGNTFGFSLPNADLIDGDSVAVEAKYPDGTTAASRQFPIATLREEVVIEIEPRSAPTLGTDPDAEAAQPRRIKGKVVDIAGSHKVSNKQVILWAAPTSTLSPVLTATTDSNGNFYGDFPKGLFRQALATVAGTLNAAVDQGVPIELVGGAGAAAERGAEFPDFVYVAVGFPADGQAPDDGGCECAQGIPPRLPDQDELVANSSTYSQDIGLS